MRELPFTKKHSSSSSSYGGDSKKRKTSSRENGNSENYKVVKTIPPKSKTSEVSEEKYLRIQKEKTSLPIYEAKHALVDEIRNNKTLVVVGETGSGKVFIS